jgi:hypothetical protein
MLARLQTSENGQPKMALLSELMSVRPQLAVLDRLAEGQTSNADTSTPRTGIRSTATKARFLGDQGAVPY